MNKPTSAVDVRAKWSKSMTLHVKVLIDVRYSLYNCSVRTCTSPLLPCHKLNNPTKIVFVSLEGNWKIIKNVSSPSHSASVFVLAFSHLKIPSEPNLFFSSCSRSWKFVLLGVKWCLHTVRYNKAASTHAAPSIFLFFIFFHGLAFWISLELSKSCDWWRHSKLMFANLSTWFAWTIQAIHSVGVMSSQVSHVSASLPRPLLHYNTRDEDLQSAPCRQSSK